MLRSDPISFTGAQGDPQCKIGVREGKGWRDLGAWLGPSWGNGSLYHIPRSHLACCAHGFSHTTQPLSSLAAKSPSGPPGDDRRSSIAGSPITLPGAHRLVPSLKVPGGGVVDDDAISDAASMQVGSLGALPLRSAVLMMELACHATGLVDSCVSGRHLVLHPCGHALQDMWKRIFSRAAQETRCCPLKVHC